MFEKPGAEEIFALKFETCVVAAFPLLTEDPDGPLEIGIAFSRHITPVTLELTLVVAFLMPPARKPIMLPLVFGADD